MRPLMRGNVCETACASLGSLSNKHRVIQAPLDSSNVRVIVKYDVIQLW